ncbi:MULTISPECIES: glycoside hydrolase family 6 protein [Micromonospora]|uniref:Glucanase n=1 Tax=Micromonospora humidisoli TaxID=2807622 RepID=A0ABS2JBE2_9ACTN|nr:MULTISPECIES: glycoside hydrolase family 6 protein [Micromonospora]MBM7083858.1 glycoside hydrolase family 6 protein [Micromonospora humidisoli]WKU07242.1 glycoside hydrolase family 6 protein [Micromonospora sp. HUAS LYJ1]GHJ06924.1 glucanase [Micromonospora sp. AKA109]
MVRSALRRGLPAVVAAVAVVLSVGAAAPAAQARPASLPSTTRFYTPPPPPAAISQIADLARSGHGRDALLLTRMVTTPQAVWFTGGTPAQVRSKVRQTVTAAARQNSVPVLVAYNIPFRDCVQYAAGGARNTAEYLAWIDAFAAGIGGRRAVVLLEPDSLGIIPFHTDLWGEQEWCRPTDAAGNPPPGASSAEHFAALTGAVDRLTRQPHVSLYLDGTHSDWLGVDESAYRLVKAGVQRTQGFFLNSENFQPTEHERKYGTWISQCVAFANNPDDGGWRLGRYDRCGSQYSPADHTDFSTWVLTDKWYAENLGRAVPTTRFVIDTSRNGNGPNMMGEYAGAPYHQPPAVVDALAEGNWCNPPGRGLGLRPTANTGVPLLDAYLWVKPPGTSDGTCDIAGGARAWDFSRYNPWRVTPEQQRRFDPLWGVVDPPFGQWFGVSALEVARRADPPLTH